eukprot:gene1986-5066_t
MRGTARDIAFHPPRSSDTVYFSSSSSPYVFSDSPLTNVKNIVIGGSSLASGRSFSRCDDLPANPFLGIDCSRFFINDESMCMDEFVFFDPDKRQSECLFFSSCATVTQAAHQASRISSAWVDVYASASSTIMQTETLPFTFEYPVQLFHEPFYVTKVLSEVILHEQVATSIASVLSGQ